MLNHKSQAWGGSVGVLCSVLAVCRICHMPTGIRQVQGKRQAEGEWKTGLVKVNVLGTKIKRLKTLAPWASPQGYGLRNVHLMPTQVASASVLARPVEPILPNRRKRANAVMRQGPSCAPDGWTRAWVLNAILARSGLKMEMSFALYTSLPRGGSNSRNRPKSLRFQ